MPAPRRLKCSLTECRLPAAPITGDCTFCDGHYCSKHRLLESHKCKNLEDVSSNKSKWWLAGLSDVLLQEEFRADMTVSSVTSARRKHSRQMPCSSKRSGRGLSGAYNRRPHQRQRRRQRQRRQGQLLYSSSIVGPELSISSDNLSERIVNDDLPQREAVANYHDAITGTGDTIERFNWATNTATN